MALAITHKLAYSIENADVFDATVNHPRR